jgi:hypothetical protein
VGEPASASQLPYTGKHGIFRLYTGPRPSEGQQAQVELAVPDNQPLEVRLNGIRCPGSTVAEPEHIKASGWEGAGLGSRQVFAVPPGAMSEGYNLVEAIAPQDITIKWVEISVR